MAMEFIQVSTLGHSVNHAFLFLAAFFAFICCFYLMFVGRGTHIYMRGRAASQGATRPLPGQWGISTAAASQ